MKTECGYCKKLLVDPFVDTDAQGRFYFFCNQDHRDKFEERARNISYELAMIGNPLFGFIFIASWIRSKFKSKKTKLKNAKAQADASFKRSRSRN